jgi:hypothetical protein
MEAARTMEGERELTTGLLSKDASFRLIVSGHVGVKEIDILIKKPQIDKAILAESEARSAGRTGLREGGRCLTTSLSQCATAVPIRSG